MALHNNAHGHVSQAYETDYNDGVEIVIYGQFGVVDEVGLAGDELGPEPDHSKFKVRKDIGKFEQRLIKNQTKAESDIF